jgi:mRNA interferase MazF
VKRGSVPVAFVPARGDIVSMTFSPQSGHEHAGWRPALVVSPEAYNRVSSLALLCPITSRVKGYPFEVALPPGAEVSGVVLVDQLRSLDWRARKARLVERAPTAVVDEVLARLAPLVT